MRLGVNRRASQLRTPASDPDKLSRAEQGHLSELNGTRGLIRVKSRFNPTPARVKSAPQCCLVSSSVGARQPAEEPGPATLLTRIWAPSVWCGRSGLGGSALSVERSAQLILFVSADCLAYGGTPRKHGWRDCWSDAQLRGQLEARGRPDTGVAGWSAAAKSCAEKYWTSRPTWLAQQCQHYAEGYNRSSSVVAKVRCVLRAGHLFQWAGQPWAYRSAGVRGFGHQPSSYAQRVVEGKSQLMWLYLKPG